MAVLPDYLNLSLLLRISNKQQTDIEYELPDDIRKWEDFALPGGYTATRGPLAANGAVGDAVTLLATTGNGVLLFAHASGSSTFPVTAGAAAVMTGNMVLFAAGEDSGSGVTSVIIENQTASVIEYTYVTLKT